MDHALTVRRVQERLHTPGSVRPPSYRCEHMFWKVTSPRPGVRPSWRAAVSRAVDLAVAFATLEDVSGPHGHPGDAEPHPHRRPLRTPPRARRPGAVAARPHLCVTPLAPPAESRRPRERARA